MLKAGVKLEELLGTLRKLLLFYAAMAGLGGGLSDIVLHSPFGDIPEDWMVTFVIGAGLGVFTALGIPFAFANLYTFFMKLIAWGKAIKHKQHRAVPKQLFWGPWSVLTFVVPFILTTVVWAGQLRLVVLCLSIVHLAVSKAKGPDPFSVATWKTSKACRGQIGDVVA